MKEFKLGKWRITYHPSWWGYSGNAKLHSLKPYRFKAIIPGWTWGPFIGEKE